MKDLFSCLRIRKPPTSIALSERPLFAQTAIKELHVFRSGVLQEATTASKTSSARSQRPVFAQAVIREEYVIMSGVSPDATGV